MELTRTGDTLRLVADAYTLTTAADRPFITLADSRGVRLAELFVPGSVHPLFGRDETVRLGDWVVMEDAAGVTLSLTAESSVWQRKTYRFVCSSQSLAFDIEVEGRGRLAEVCYFGGYYSGQVRWGAGFFVSGQHFRRGFNPEPNTAEVYHFPPDGGATIDLMGVPLPGKDHWFFTPPPFCFAFQIEDGWLALGISAQPGANSFTEYRYHGARGAFHLSLSYEGHTPVEGVYRLPAISFDFAPDEYAALAAHTAALRAEKLELSHALENRHSERSEESLPKSIAAYDPLEIPRGVASPAASAARNDIDETHITPAWWREPIFCGWGAQCHVAAQAQGRAPDYSRQELYERFLSALAEQNLSPGIVVLDDKWQATYGENCADEGKWPDLRGFITAQHAAGRRVLLWLKAWDPEGLPVEECITNAAGQPVAADPTHPAYERRLRASVRHMLSSHGYDADGFKIDFTARLPSGPGLSAHRDVWGLELMKLYLSLLHSEAKRTKLEAMVMTHTPHPYLTDVVDVIRLNDINTGAEVNRAMTHRARVARLACPEAVIDTDNWPVPNRAAWRDYVRLQPQLGVPSLYYATHIDSTGEPLEAEDYQLLREVWAKHREGLES